MKFFSLLIGFVLLKSVTAFNESEFKILNDTKMCFMYFIESFLSGVKVRGIEMKGLPGLFAPVKLWSSMEEYKKKLEHSDKKEMDFINIFSRQLKIGINLQSSIPIVSSYFRDNTSLRKEALKIQTEFLQNLKHNENDYTAIIPFDWAGCDPHAVVFSVKWNKLLLSYDLAVINSGAGVQYHPYSKDPECVHPYLNRLWIEFKNIPESEIFDDVAWFIHALIVLNNDESCIRIEKITTMNAYLYETILANFTKYVVVPSPKDLEEKSVPAQLSGSCTVSSLLAAVLYHSPDMSSFYHFKLKFGLHFLSEYLDKHEFNSEFTSIISDGFDSVARNLFKNVASSISTQVFQYLEHAHPNEFKNFGLLGRNRAKWLRDNKPAAIAFLKDRANTGILTLIKDSIKLSARLLRILNNNPVKKCDNLILIKDDVRYSRPVLSTFNSDSPDLWYKVDVKKFLLQSNNTRDWMVHKKLSIALKNLCRSPDSILKDSMYYIRVLDVFRLSGKDWWKQIESNESRQDILDILSSIRNILNVFLQHKNRIFSFEVLAVLAHFQLAAWKAAVRYDTLQTSPEFKLNLSSFHPPKTIQNSIFSGRFLSFDTKNIENFSHILTAEHFQMFKSVIAELESSNNTEVFLHPIDMFTDYSPIYKSFDVSKFYDKVKNLKLHALIYEKLSKTKSIQAVIQSKQTSDRDWMRDYAPLKVLFTEDSILKDEMPYFNDLMYILAGVYSLPFIKNSASADTANTLCSSSSSSDENSFQMLDFKMYSSLYSFTNYTNNYSSIFDKVQNPTSLVLNHDASSELSNIFYMIRHSEASLAPNNITNIESWLNFVKNSVSSYIFKNASFIRLSDNLLNTPILLRKYIIINYSIYANIEVDISSLYPVGFNTFIIKDVVASLLAIIALDLKIIKTRWKKLKQSKKTDIITTVVEISTILTRFIDRIENDHFVPAQASAKILSRLYNVLEPFSYLSNAYKLTNPNISAINLALTHITSIQIRNGESFLENLNISTLGLDPRRRTLAKFHWFITKQYYYVEAPNNRIADSQFNYPIPAYPLDEAERPFMEALLIKNFLPTIFKSKDNNPQHYTFSYFSDGNIIEIRSIQTSECVYLQLNDGIYIFNDKLKVEISSILNHTLFLNYFSEADRAEASTVGALYQIFEKIVYVLQDFKGKGENLLFIFDSQSRSDSSCIYRQWQHPITKQARWYRYISDSRHNSNFHESTQYKWTKNAKIFLHTSHNHSNSELILFDNGGQEVTVRYVLDGCHPCPVGTLHISNFNLTDGWTVLDKTCFSQKNFEFFDESDYILARTLDGKIVIIFPGVRLPDDLDRPLVLFETYHNSNLFEILNSTDLLVETEQNVFGNMGLPGSLVVRKEEKKYLLLPLREVLSRKDGSNGTKDYIKPATIRYIPMSDNYPQPQTRLDALLLAYYCTLAFNFKTVMHLLHPSSTFVNQNEVFSREEVAVLNWIITIDKGGPESMAVQIMSFMHIVINQNKFPLEYIKYNESDTDTDRRYVNLDEIKSIMQNIFKYYFLSIRNLSEKYYTHRLFPESVSNVYWDDMLKSKSEFSGYSIEVPEYDSGMNVYREYSGYAIASNNLSLGEEVESINIFNLVHENSKLEPEFLKVWKRFIHRRMGKKDLYNADSLVVYCFINSPENWSDFKLSKFRGSPREIIRDKYHDCISSCRKLYDKDFLGFNFKDISSKTDLKSIRSVLIEDLASKSCSHNDSSVLESNPDEMYDVNEIEIGQFEQIRIKLLLFLVSNNNYCTQYFVDPLLKQSVSLSKLSKSIDKFAKEIGGKKVDHNIFTHLPEIEQDIDALLNLINAKISDLDKKQTSAMIELSAKTADISSDDISIYDATEVLNRVMHQNKTKTFLNLYSCYSRNSLPCFQKKFFQFDRDQCISLQKATKLFYSRQVLLDYLYFIRDLTKRILESIETISSDSLDLYCVELKKISEFKSRHLSPAILNFEFRSKKYRLRSEQVKDINLLISLDSRTKNYTSVVIQRMMAAGKTLVLGTISVVSKALNKERLSILVPPSSLYQSSTSSMQGRTYSFYKQRGETIVFPRFPLPDLKNSAIASYIRKYLDHVLDLINRTMQFNNYLVLSPDSIQSFINSYVELLFACDTLWSQDFFDILTRYATIYNIFKQKGSIIMDEIDMTMDPMKELNFPIIETEPYNMMAASLMTDIIEFAIFDPEIKAANLDILGNNQSSLTHTGYKLCRELILNYVEKQLLDPKSMWSKYLFEQDESKILCSNGIMLFLRNTDMNDKIEWIKKLYETLPHPLVDALIIIKVQLYSYLEDSFRGTVNQNYGCADESRPDIKFAVPYVAANTPSQKSVFADRWETLNKTLLMNASVPINMKTAKEVTAYLRDTVCNDSISAGVTCLSSTSHTLKLLLPDIKPSSLDPEVAEHVLLIYHALNRKSPAAIRILFDYCLNVVFLEMKFHTGQISSNALNMASIFGSIQGYSGTIDNVNILPQKVVANAYYDHLDNEKFNGGIALKLMKDFEDCLVPELDVKVFTETVRSLIKGIIGKQSASTADSVSAFIDTGAFFKNFKNIQVAEGILSELPRIEAVIYYDETSNQLEFIRRLHPSYIRGYISTSDPEAVSKAIQVDISEIFTFFDQRHTTGSDILQPENAHAILTISPRVLLRDILQGTLRMRKFMTTQKVHLVTTTSTKYFYYSRSGNLGSTEIGVKVSDLLSLGALNEDEKQRNENEKLAYAKIDNEIRSFILNFISLRIASTTNIDADLPKWISSTLSSSKSVFIRSTKEIPIRWLQKAVLGMSESSLKSYAYQRLADAKFILANLSTSSVFHKKYKVLVKYVNSMISENHKAEPGSLLFYLPEMIRTREKSTDTMSGFQTEVLSHTQVDLSLDQFIDQSHANMTQSEYKNINLKALDYNSSTYLSDDQNYLNLHGILNSESFSPFQKLLANFASLSKGFRVGISLDLIRMHVRSSASPIFSKHSRDGSHFLIHIGRDFFHNLTGVTVFLLSIENARSIYEQLKSSNTNSFVSHFWLCDLSGRVTATTEIETLNQNVIEFIPEARILIFDVLIFNGSLNHILSNERLLDLYQKRFLKGPHSKNRASFLALRMKVLQGKDAFLFDKDDPEMNVLRSFVNGDTVNFDNLNDKNLYPKRDVLEVDEQLHNSKIQFNYYNFKKEFDASIKVKTKIDFELKRELVEIFGEPRDQYEGETYIPSYHRYTDHIPEKESNVDQTKFEGIFSDNYHIPISNPGKWENIPHYALDETIDAYVDETFNDQQASDRLKCNSDDLLNSDSDSEFELYDEFENLFEFTSSDFDFCFNELSLGVLISIISIVVILVFLIGATVIIIERRCYPRNENTESEGPSVSQNEPDVDVLTEESENEFIASDIQRGE